MSQKQSGSFLLKVVRIEYRYNYKLEYIYGYLEGESTHFEHFTSTQAIIGKYSLYVYAHMYIRDRVWLFLAYTNQIRH